MKQILVAYDGGEPARVALQAGVDLVKSFGGSLSAVSVIPFHSSRVGIDPWDDRAEHDRQIAEARQLLAEQGVVGEFLEPAGDPAASIERVAEMGRFDTIVVGSRGLGPVARFLQGSVSEHVATHATATVVIAR